MKERPILFNSEMVKAIMENRKSQTRRVIKPQPEITLAGDWMWGVWIYNHIPYGKDEVLKSCPHGVPRDKLWVREAFTYGYRGKNFKNQYVTFKDGGQKYRDGAYYIPQDDYKKGAFDHIKWKPSIHMFRWASRIILEITAVRVEKVQDISAKDCVKEGLKLLQGGIRSEFAVLWDSINKKRGFGWAKNPWVWVISFKRIEP